MRVVYCLTGNLINSRKDDPMSQFIRRWIAHPSVAFGSTLLWGMVEFLALARSRWSMRLRHDR